MYRQNDQLGISKDDKVLLFFGNIAPYKGLEYLVAAFDELLKKEGNYRLLIIGSPKGPATYWNQIRRGIENSGIADRVIEKIEYVPDRGNRTVFQSSGRVDPTLYSRFPKRCALFGVQLWPACHRCGRRELEGRNR